MNVFCLVLFFLYRIETGTLKSIVLSTLHVTKHSFEIPPAETKLFSSCGNTGELQSNKTSKRCEVSIFHKITSRTYKYVPHHGSQFFPKSQTNWKDKILSFFMGIIFSTCLGRLSDSSLSNHSPLHRSEGFATKWKGFAGMVNGLTVKTESCLIDYKT